MENIDKYFDNLKIELEKNNNDIVIINNRFFSLKWIMSLSTNDLYNLLSVKPGMKLYKYCPFNKYTKEYIISGNVYLNDPNKFDDAFDSLSDIDEYTFINFRLQFYLLSLNVSYDFNLSNDEQ